MDRRSAGDGGSSAPGAGTPARGVQPRAVLALLLGASAVGVWVTHRADPVPVRAVAWLAVTSIGSLAGGLYWRLVLFDRSTPAATGSRRSVRGRWRRLEAAVVAAFSLSGLGYLAVVAAGGSLGAGGAALGLGVVAAPMLRVGIRRRGEADRRTRVVRAALLAVVLVSLGGFARLETGTGAAEWLVRLGHVGAFSAWIGGAVWHNFVVLPTVRSGSDAVSAVKSQARRFRRHLPAVVALLLGTGVLQTIDLLGRSVRALVGSSVGRLVGIKVVVLAVLTALVAANYRQSA